MSQWENKNANKTIVLIGLGRVKRHFSNLRSNLPCHQSISKPLDGEKLYIYLVVSKHAISSVLVKVNETFKSQSTMLVKFCSKLRCAIQILRNLL